jgi:dihydrofolate reductase
MAKLIYSAIASLDGYMEDAIGNFNWAEPDEEVHTFVNDLQRPVGTDQPPFVQDFARIWQSADKIVYSTTLETTSSARTRIERSFDPESIRRLKSAVERDITVGGPGLAAHGIKAGLVDEYHLLLAPIIVGGGKPLFPDDVRIELELLDERRFGNGVVFLRYRSRSAA